jgi:hypothetical protein
MFFRFRLIIRTLPEAVVPLTLRQMALFVRCLIGVIRYSYTELHAFITASKQCEENQGEMSV